MVVFAGLLKLWAGREIGGVVEIILGVCWRWWRRYKCENRLAC
jgi:hypothetical protein